MLIHYNVKNVKCKDSNSKGSLQSKVEGATVVIILILFAICVFLSSDY